MTHDPRALELIAGVRDDDDDAMALAYAHDALDALTAAGLRIVPVEPSDEDVERAADAIWRGYRENYAFILRGRGDAQILARAAIRAFLNGGGDE